MTTFTRAFWVGNAIVRRGSGRRGRCRARSLPRYPGERRSAYIVIRVNDRTHRCGQESRPENEDRLLPRSVRGLRLWFCYGKGPIYSTTAPTLPLSASAQRPKFRGAKGKPLREAKKRLHSRPLQCVVGPRQVEPSPPEGRQSAQAVAGALMVTIPPSTACTYRSYP